jgi:hypothetical protein
MLLKSYQVIPARFSVYWWDFKVTGMDVDESLMTGDYTFLTWVTVVLPMLEDRFAATERDSSQLTTSIE